MTHDTDPITGGDGAKARERLDKVANREGLNYIANEQGDIVWTKDLRAILSLPVHTGEAVAWRWRWNAEYSPMPGRPGRWNYTENGECGDARFKDVEPLFLSTQQQESGT